MLVTCEECGIEYDDVYRRTYCPHKEFAMRQTLMLPDGSTSEHSTLESVDKAIAVYDAEQRDEIDE